jgi:hypothetical protein
MTGINLGGWIILLAVGLILVIIAPHVPPPGGRICKIIGLIALVIGAVLFLVWLLTAVLVVA